MTARTSGGMTSNIGSTSVKTSTPRNVCNCGRASCAGERSGLTIFTPAEIFALPKDQHACILVDRVAAKGQSLVIAGQPSIGKTPLALQLIVSINTKRHWCGLETHGEPLVWLYLQNENSCDRLEKDLAALLEWGPNFDQSKLHVQVYRTHAGGFLSLDERQAVANIEKAIRDIQPTGIVCDPLRDFGIGDLNSDQDMIATLRELS
jgi:RecA-family ATPase